MEVSLTPKLKDFVKQKVKSGLYSNASEVMREGLRLLIDREGSPIVEPQGFEERPRKADVITELHRLENELRRRGVDSISLFGSLATDNATAESDIDLLVDIQPDLYFSLVDLASLQLFLEDSFNRPVDVFVREAIQGRIGGQAVLDQAERIF